MGYAAGWKARQAIKGLAEAVSVGSELSGLTRDDFPRIGLDKDGIPDIFRPKAGWGSGADKVKRALYEFAGWGYKNRHQDREAMYRLRQSGGQRGYAGYGNGLVRKYQPAVKSGRSSYSKPQFSSLGAGTTGGNQVCHSVASNVPGM